MTEGTWTEARVGHLADYFNGYAFKPEQWSSDGLPIIRIQNITDPEAPANRFDGTLDERRYLVRPGDIIVSWSASLNAYVWPGPEPGWLNQHIFKVEPHEHVVRRDYYPWLATWFLGELDRERHGSTMTHLTWGTFSSFKVPLPDLATQTAIADYLDSETVRIDTLIDRKQRFIDLLLEKRTALITHAVTKGLDPGVEMKDSGVEWIGSVPTHWNVVALRYLAKRIVNGATPISSEPAYWGGDIPWATPEDLTASGELLCTTKRMITDEGYRSCGTSLVPAGSLLISCRAPIGTIAISSVDVCFNQGCKAVVPSSLTLSRYLYYVLCAGGDYLQSLGQGSTFMEISRSDLGGYKVPAPPLQEQMQLVEHLDGGTRRIDILVDKTRRSIDLLREYRTALISAAVTGQIDIPGTDDTEDVA